MNGSSELYRFFGLEFSIDKENQMATKHHHLVGLDDRTRDEDGTIRRKRDDTLVRTLRKEFGDDFAKGIRSDATLRTVLEKTGAKSLSELLKKSK